MTEILAYVGQVATTAFEVATQAVTWITANPLALLGVISMLVVSFIGVARHLIRGV